VAGDRRADVVVGRAHQHGYLMRVLIALDQLGNALTGGYADETISSRLGKRKIQRGGNLRWSDWGGIAKPLDEILDLIDPGHSIEAIELDEGRDVRDGPKDDEETMKLPQRREQK